MKLELKHLAGYLPYNLGVWHNEWKEILIMDSTGSKSYTLSIEDIDEYAKPILRPLYGLIKENWNDGEKFIPIVELYKMRTQHMTDKVDKYYIENNTAILKLEEITTPDGKISFVHYFEIDIDIENIHFSICTETINNSTNEVMDESFGFIGNEFNMLQKLYEWHFDIHGLIEKGLAIDINAIEPC